MQCFGAVGWLNLWLNLACLFRQFIQTLSDRPLLLKVRMVFVISGSRTTPSDLLSLSLGRPEMACSHVCYLAGLGTYRISALCQAGYDNPDCPILTLPTPHGLDSPVLKNITQDSITPFDNEQPGPDSMNAGLESDTSQGIYKSR
jgi:hypothetical protein